MSPHLVANKKMAFTTTTPILDAVRATYDLGYIPVPVRGKAPFIGGYQQYSTGELPHPSWEQVETWFREHHTGFALLCGTLHQVDGKRYRLLGLDIDLKEVEACQEIMSQIPQSPSVKKGSKGFTAFFLVPEDMGTSHSLRGVYDWIAKKKVTVMPPSAHPDLDGGEYEWIETQYFTTKADGQMVAPDQLPIFGPDQYEQMREIAETHVPQAVIEVIKREYDGTEPNVATHAWVNDELVKHERMSVWLPALLDASRIPYDIEKSGKIKAVNWLRKPEKNVNARTKNWHFTADGVEGRSAGIVDFGDGSTWTPLEAIAAIATKQDIRGKAVPDDIWEMGLCYADPELYKCIKDDAGWDEFVQANVAAQTKVDAEKAMDAQRVRSAAIAETLIVEQQAQAVASETSVEVDPMDPSMLTDVEIETKDLTTEHMKPVPDWVCENAPGLIGDIYRDILDRFAPDTPPSIALNTALMMCAAPAALRVTQMTPRPLTPSLYLVTLAYTGEGKNTAKTYPSSFFGQAQAKSMADPRLVVQQLPAFARFQAHFNGTLKGPGWEPDLPGPDPVDFGLTPDATDLGVTPMGGDMTQGERQLALQDANQRYSDAYAGWQGDIKDARDAVKMMPVLGTVLCPNTPTGAPAFLEECYYARGRVFVWDEFGKKWSNAMKLEGNNDSWDTPMIEAFNRGPVSGTAKVESKEKNVRKFDAYDLSSSMHGFCTPEQLIDSIKANAETVSDGALNRRLIFMDKLKPPQTDEEAKVHLFDTSDLDEDVPKELLDHYLALWTGFNDATLLPSPGVRVKTDREGKPLIGEDGAQLTEYHHPMEELIWVGHRTPKEYMVVMDLAEGGRRNGRNSSVGKLMLEIHQRYNKQRIAASTKGDKYTANSLVRGAEHTWRVACVAAYADHSTEVQLGHLLWADQYVSVGMSNMLGMVGKMIVPEATKDEERILELLTEAYEEHLGLKPKTKSAIVVRIEEGGAQGMASKRDLFNRFRSGKQDAAQRFKIAMGNLTGTDRLVIAESKPEGRGRPMLCYKDPQAWDLAYAQMMAGDAY